MLLFSAASIIKAVLGRFSD